MGEDDKKINKVRSVLRHIWPISHLLHEEKGPAFLKTLTITVISLVSFVLVWQGLSMLLNSPYLPEPSIVLQAFVDAFNITDISVGRNMWDNIYSSLNRVLWGFALAFVIAVPLGLVMGFSKTADDFSKPIIEVFRPIPPLAWAPVLIIAMGVFLGPVVVIFIGIFFPLLSNIVFGVRNIDPILIDAARTLGAKRSHLFIKVILPSTIPYIMTGIRIGLGIGWMCIVAAEFIAPIGGGVGQYIYFKSNIGRYDQVFAGLIVIAILGLVTTELSGYIERRVSKRMGMS
ncbi:MAG TPA: ABC transporter permease [Methanomassiliicoccales archaeon]|nr:ABC transporter permease [Methanomassiliicoccales archaeon]